MKTLHTRLISVTNELVRTSDGDFKLEKFDFVFNRYFKECTCFHRDVVLEINSLGYVKGFGVEKGGN